MIWKFLLRRIGVAKQLIHSKETLSDVTDMQNTYGFKFDDLDRLAQLLEELLEIHWTARESSFFGDYFISAKSPGERFSLRSNYVEGEGWSIRKFRAYSLLLHVTVATRERQEELERRFQEKLDCEWKLIDTKS